MFLTVCNYLYSRKKTELPFGENPFAKKATPSACTNANTALPPPAITKNAPPQNQRHKKRQQVTIVDFFRCENAKKSKTTPNGSSSAAIILGDLIKDNFRDEDISNWSKSGKVEAGFCFKQPLGEKFFHGLDLLNSLGGGEL